MILGAYGLLLKNHTRFVLFGLITAFASSFGQTYFIGIFGHAIQQDFAMSHTQWGGIYMAGTLLSALLLPITGKLIDQVTLQRYTFFVVLCLAFACWFITQVHSLAWLVVGVFLLRQSGQGLMSHVAYTSMGRYFDQQRGKATAMAAMGFAAGEAVLPLIAVMAIAAVGWRWSYAGVALIVLVLILPTSLWLLRGHHGRHQDYEQKLKQSEEVSLSQQAFPTQVVENPTSVKSWRRRDVLKDYRFYLILPGVSATSVVSTALFFHHLNLADEKGWSHTFMTGNYLLYSFIVTVMAVIAGQLIDRFSALALMPFTLLPIAAALLMINLVDSYWVIWPYMVLLGIGSGLSQTAQAALWPECYGVRYLGSIKSLFWTVVVFASALGPVWLGYLVDLGYSFQQSVLTMVVYLLLSTGLMIIGLRGFRLA
ncbi:MFS transporter [Candidatus Njordibacter sp. Uisw_039]|jgi:MFS family permease|uniref:MFS transporter n=1 Tax=Candidatus Njordibacter sp. Uisw_039 TaxID=3230972 RepID=UPI003A245067|tara:strand:+ start:5464 stop:6738 length:1275 start_codon:yes stop_codon:yes gene_type:complete